IDDAMLAHKAEVVARAVERHGGGHEPLATLAALGGLEHAALVGVILAGAAARVPVLLDGLITNAAALAAAAIAPDAVGWLVAGHRSIEPGAAIALKHLELDALLDLDLRLGEGTGALLAVPLVQAAAAILTDMALLDDLAG
ncbi:MAG: nicotinate-nucleotide--dimethylbenzimidazole phosphoribosyltransferase, partial [Nitriliruptorales bacterium]|nr:nicotinate-nucleotide--dimethylbenzimidazole phosphoribosyltransferase [Nitriliruptorales bacterium]